VYPGISKKVDLSQEASVFDSGSAVLRETFTPHPHHPTPTPLKKFDQKDTIYFLGVKLHFVLFLNILCTFLYFLNI